MQIIISIQPRQARLERVGGWRSALVDARIRTSPPRLASHVSHHQLLLLFALHVMSELTDIHAHVCAIGGSREEAPPPRATAVSLSCPSLPWDQGKLA